MLELVLKIFFRLSLSIEDEAHYFTAQYYSKLIYDNWIFDMAKLIDIAAVFGQSNRELVQRIIQNVFDGQKQYIEDFKEGIELIMNRLKKMFSDAIKIQQDISGDTVYQKTKQEINDFIMHCFYEYIEVLSTLLLIAQSFPSEVLDMLRNTTTLTYLANAYAMVDQKAKKWSVGSLDKIAYFEYRKMIKALSFSIC